MEKVTMFYSFNPDEITTLLFFFYYKIMFENKKGFKIIDNS